MDKNIHTYIFVCIYIGIYIYILYIKFTCLCTEHLWKHMQEIDCPWNEELSDWGQRWEEDFSLYILLNFEWYELTALKS